MNKMDENQYKCKCLHHVPFVNLVDMIDFLDLI